MSHTEFPPLFSAPLNETMTETKRTNREKIILHLCADMGTDSKAYRDAGYQVICVGQKIGVENYHPPKGVYGVIANPPCTMFSIARTKAKTPRDLREGMRLVKECLRIIWECQYDLENENQRTSPLAFWALENPGTGMLRWFLGNPRFEYCQSEYGQPFTKRTALWGNFNIPYRPFMESCINQCATSLGGNQFKKFGSKFAKSGDGGGKAECPALFAKYFMEANP
jgi:hypothetical protein